MKNAIRFVVIVCFALLFISSAWVKLTLIRPADVFVTRCIQSIVVLDRTLSADQKKNSIEEKYLQEKS